MNVTLRTVKLFSVFLFAAALLGLAQTRTLTTSDYEHAEKFMGYNTHPLVYHAGVRPTWLSDEHFWYRTTTEEGARFILVDAAKNTRGPAFDQTKVAALLSTALGGKYEAGKLPFQTIELADDAKSFTFNATGKRWKCDTAGTACASIGNPSSTERSDSLHLMARAWRHNRKLSS